MVVRTTDLLSTNQETRDPNCAVIFQAAKLGDEKKGTKF
jgi:hypothetical protein